MFTPNQSSPMVPVGKANQTSIDSFSRPTTRQAKKAAMAKGPRAAMSGSKQKEVDDQEWSGNQRVSAKKRTLLLLARALNAPLSVWRKEGPS